MNLAFISKYGLGNKKKKDDDDMQTWNTPKFEVVQAYLDLAMGRLSSFCRYLNSFSISLK